MTALHSKGTILSHGDGASTEVFTAVGNITKITGPGGGKATVIDTSTLSSTAKEKMIGLPDEGTVTIEVNYIPGDTVHKALLADRAAGRLCNWKLTFSDTGASVVAFSAYIMSFQVDEAVDAKVTASIELEVSGAVTWPA